VLKIEEVRRESGTTSAAKWNDADRAALRVGRARQDDRVNFSSSECCQRRCVDDDDFGCNHRTPIEAHSLAGVTGSTGFLHEV
jgi:hypothetical protein